MIVTHPKNLEDILKATESFGRILIVGCGGCVATLQTGSPKQAETLKASMETQRKAKGLSGKIDATVTPRQCDKHLVEKVIAQTANTYDALISLACGVGAQTLAELYPYQPIVPANDTMFLGMHNTEESKFYEMCRACGNCILSETGGICPLTRCAKSLLNGPCGGQVGGKCEAGGWKKDCAWVLIYKRLKNRNKLDQFTRFRLPQDWRTSEPPRELDARMSTEKKTATSIELGGIEEAVKKRVAYSELMKQMLEGRFVYTGELEPLKTTNMSEVVEGARILKDHIVAINITDNPTAFGFMNALVPSYLIQKETGVEAVFQMTARDRNRLALFSDVLAAGYLGIKNVLALTGDYTTVGDTPQAKPVFDLDSATFVYMLRKIIDEGMDLNGNKIENAPKFNVGVAASPNADPIEPEILKIERKVRLGADFIQTQCVYSLEQAQRFLEASAYFKTPVLLGLAPFKSLAMMEWMIKYVPGIKVPKDLEQRLRKAREKSKETFQEENVETFSTMIREIRQNTKAAGVHLMAVGFEWIIPKIIERSNTH